MIFGGQGDRGWPSIGRLSIGRLSIGRLRVGRLRGLRLRRVRVRGPSMAPTLSDGDIALAWLLAGGRRLASQRAGAVVLVRWPSRPGQLSVKRAVRPAGSGDTAGWFVLGDNDFGSTDSRELGPADVVGVVLCRLWPRPRSLRVRRVRRDWRLERGDG